MIATFLYYFYKKTYSVFDSLCIVVVITIFGFLDGAYPGNKILLYLLLFIVFLAQGAFSSYLEKKFPDPSVK